jgi:hypothetical protein
MAGEFVNLNEVGGLTQAGRQYDASAQDGQGASRKFLGQMQASERGLRGGAGSTFTGITSTHGGNMTLLAKQIAEQAIRAVRGEESIVTADDDSVTAQQPVGSAVEGATTTMSRTITA